MSWYIQHHEETRGPYDLVQLIELARQKELLPATMIWKAGSKDWIEARAMPFLWEPELPEFSPSAFPPPLPSPLEKYNYDGVPFGNYIPAESLLQRNSHLPGTHVESQEIRANAEKAAVVSASVYTAILLAAALIGAFWLLMPIEINRIVVAIAGATVLLFAVPLFKIICKLTTRSQYNATKCKACGRDFALKVDYDEVLVAAVSRVSRESIQPTTDRSHDYIKETTWVDEKYRVTGNWSCVYCEFKEKEVYYTTRETGQNISNIGG